MQRKLNVGLPDVAPQHCLRRHVVKGLLRFSGDRVTFRLVNCTPRSAWHTGAPSQPACSDATARANAARFSSAVARYGMVNSSCPGNHWMVALRDLDVATQHAAYAATPPRDRAAMPTLVRRAINIGANKGYLVSELLGHWAPWMRLNPQSLRELLDTVPVKASSQPWGNREKCGVCTDCRTVITPAPKPPGGAPVAAPWEAWLATHVSVTVWAAEPAPVNVALLSAAAMNLTASGHVAALVPVHCGLADFNGFAAFPDPPAGWETGSLDPESNAVWHLPVVNVSIVTLDSFYATHVDPAATCVMDILAVDTEGYDPAVLDGASKTLPFTRLLIFEYHGMALWHKDRRNLKDVVAALDGTGFSCYLMWGPSLIPLTRCWDNVFEFYYWSNVLCVNRRDPVWSAAIADIAAAGGWGA